MHVRTDMSRLVIHALLLVMMIGFASPALSQSLLQPFTTDGCSRFPDRARVGRVDWCHCCVKHDLAYWRGGTAQARLDADRALKTCVEQVSDDKILANTMYAGVRAAGGPEVNVPYRWGYGWPYGRRYEPLTSEEEKLAAALESAYREKNPELTCRK